MRNRTRIIAAAAAVTAALAGTTGTAMAAANCTKPVPTATTVAATSKQPPSLSALAAQLGVSPARLDQALREVKIALGKAGGTPSQEQFDADLARVLGIPLARVRQVFPPETAAAKGAGTKTPGTKTPGTKGHGTKPPHSTAPAQSADEALAAAVARELNVSLAKAEQALQPLFAAGRADTSSPSFAAAAKSLGVSVQRLADALAQAKQGAAGS